MEAVNLNIIPGKAWPVCHASQFDIGRTIRFNLFEGTAEVTLDGTETITVNVKKPDGNVVTAAVTNTSSNYVEVVTTEQMTACDGANLAELKIEKGADVIGTLNFILDVEVDPLKNGIESESAIHNLEQQIADAVADQYDADAVVFDSVPTAGHGVGFAVTSEGVLNSLPDELDDLDDVTTTSPAVGEALVWDGTKWTNGTVSTVGSIDDLNDVDTTGKADNDNLRYDSTAQEWIAKPATVTLTQAEYDQLKLDGDLLTGVNYIITDAPQLEYTADDISYDGSTVTARDMIVGVIQTITLPVADWSGNTITVSVTGVTATSNQEIFGLEASSPANIANNLALQVANLMDAGQAAGTITLYADSVPSSDLNIRVIVRY